MPKNSGLLPPVFPAKQCAKIEVLFAIGARCDGGLDDFVAHLVRNRHAVRRPTQSPKIVSWLPSAWRSWRPVRPPAPFVCLRAGSGQPGDIEGKGLQRRPAKRQDEPSVGRAVSISVRLSSSRWKDKVEAGQRIARAMAPAATPRARIGDPV